MKIVQGFAVLVLGAGLMCPKERTASVPCFNLTIQAENVNSSKGVIGVLVFASGRGWPEDSSAAFRSEAIAARKGVTSLTISSLPAGEYAVVVLHDENENMRLDRGRFGVPREQWGMSNNPKAVLSAPRFDEARFALHGDQQIDVRLSR